MKSLTLLTFTVYNNVISLLLVFISSLEVAVLISKYACKLFSMHCLTLSLRASPLFKDLSFFRT